MAAESDDTPGSRDGVWAQCMNTGHERIHTKQDMTQTQRAVVAGKTEIRHTI
jgi:hypothetical protein